MEHYIICKACGKGFTYTDEDVQKNISDAKGNAWSAIGAMAGALSGNWGGAIANQQNYKDLKDYNRCPHCSSENIEEVTFEEFQRTQRKMTSGGVAAQINTNATVDTLLKRIQFMIEDGDWYGAEMYCNQILDQDPENLYAYIYLTLAMAKATSLDELPAKDIDIKQTQHYKRLIQYGDDSLRIKMDKLSSEYLALDEEKMNSAIYSLAKGFITHKDVKPVNGGDEDNNLKCAISELKKIHGYKDADALLEQCEKELESRINGRYEKAVTLMDQGYYNMAAANFSKLGDYLDSADRLAACRKSKNEKDKSNAKKISLIVVAGLIVLAAIFIGLSMHHKSLANKYEEGLSGNEYQCDGLGFIFYDGKYMQYNTAHDDNGREIGTIGEGTFQVEYKQGGYHLIRSDTDYSTITIDEADDEKPTVLKVEGEGNGGIRFYELTKSVSLEEFEEEIRKGGINGLTNEISKHANWTVSDNLGNTGYAKFFSDGTGKSHMVKDISFTWKVKDAETVELSFIESGKTFLAMWNGSCLKYTINDAEFTMSPRD